MRKSTKNLKVKSLTWSKESHGLFDYESHHLTINRASCNQNLQIYRNDKEVVFMGPNSQKAPENSTSLCNIKVNDDGRFILSPPDDLSPIKLVIRSLKSGEKQKGYELKAGDRVKIGRLEYYVREIRNKDGIVQKASNSPLCLNYKDGMDIEDKEFEKKNCRICYNEESVDEKSSPELKFLSPCKCKGTSQYIHFFCLHEWLESKKLLQKTSLPQIQNQPTSENYIAQIHNYLISMQSNSADNMVTTNILEELIPHFPNGSAFNVQPPEQTDIQRNNVKTHVFKNFCCDVCHEVLPFLIVTNRGNEYETVDIPRPDKEPYMLFERLSQGKDPKMFSLIKGIQDGEIKIGRGHTSDIVISDISVSRFHAFVKYQNGSFYLFDKNSKFGTLVEVQGPIEIQNEKIGIQCGRTLITFAIREEKAKDEELEVLGGCLSKSAEMSTLASPNSRKSPNQKKKIQSSKKTVKKKKNQDGGSEGTVDVEEIAPLIVNKGLHTRSKKINKRSKRAPNK